ncbi:MAG TPA: MFS transporter [Acidimicrobiales bacterium]|nr:MFS transporter [Acidimicrobiales bacterium]
MATMSTTPVASAGPARRPHAALATLSFVLFLTFLDNTIVSVVLADVQSNLHAGVSSLQWVVNGYALVFASLMLTFGTLGDLFGRKKIMLAGVAVFCAGSVMAAVAPSVHVLIAGRAVMGLGAAASEPGTLSMIRQLYPDRRERARAYGVWGAVSGLALALGPVVGGVLAGVWSWRAVFWFNLFFGLVALVGAAVTLPETSDPVDKRLDVFGFAFGAAALATASFATIAGETSGYATWWVILLYALSFASAVSFFHYERRAANPVLNLTYFRRPAFGGSNFVAFSTYFSTFAIFFFVALYLQAVAQVSAYTTAVDFLPMAAGMVIASIFTGRWVAATGPRIPMAVGCALAGVGVLLTDIRLGTNPGLLEIGWTMALAGIGFGIAVVPVTSSAMSVIPQEHSGMAASMTNTSRELGAVAGVAILGSIVNGQLTVYLIQRLSAIGIPKQFQNLVITAVTTGTFNSSAAKSVGGSAQLNAIINKIVNAAYAAFGRGLDLALMIAASLMLLSALVALLSMRVPPSAQGDDGLV